MRYTRLIGGFIAAYQVLSALKPIFDGFAKYVSFGAYVQDLARSRQRGLQEYHKEADFWRDLIGYDLDGHSSQNKLRLNDIVALRGFQLSEWFPRSPGTYWTLDGKARRDWAANHIERWDQETEVLSPTGKTQLVTGGVGTCRVKAHDGGNDKRYGLLCATSSGICDAGIPVVVEEAVYDSVCDALHDDGGVEADLTGRLMALPFDRVETLISARGAEIPDHMKSLLTTPLEVPSYYLRVESRLQVKKLASDFRLEASAWTLYSDDAGAWSFTYAGFDPRAHGAIERATQFLTNYVDRHGGRRIYTDFDEHVSRLDSRHPIGSVMTGNADFSADVQELVTWGASLQGAWESRDPYRYM